MKQLPLPASELQTFATKVDEVSMAYPFFSLRKGGEKEPVVFADLRSGARIEIQPSAIGSATIWDKDILIYLASNLRQALDDGRPVNGTVAVTAADLLAAIRRGSGGKDYRELERALDRLVGTRFKTNLPTANLVEKQNFSVLTTYELRETLAGRMTSISITVSDWFLRSIQAEAIVTIDPDYFLLTSGVARRVYELLRKHLGRQPCFVISLSRLQQKCGSARNLRQFKHDLRKVVGMSPTRLLDLWAYQDGQSLFAFPNELAAQERARSTRAKSPSPSDRASAIPRSECISATAAQAQLSADGQSAFPSGAEERRSNEQPARRHIDRPNHIEGARTRSSHPIRLGDVMSGFLSSAARR